MDFYNIFYGYGYYLSDEKIKTLPEDKKNQLKKSKWYFKIQDDAFFGIYIRTINPNDCYLVPEENTIDNRFVNMIEEYKSIFKEHPGIAHNYIINQIGVS